MNYETTLFYNGNQRITTTITVNRATLYLQTTTIYSTYKLNNLFSNIFHV